MSVLTSTLGYPRIGEDRELKKALEGFWSGRKSDGDLEHAAAQIRRNNWQTQKDTGIDLIPSNDFSLYDHVLDTSCLVGAVPQRFGHNSGDVSLDTYFRMARGSTATPSEICCATHSAVGDIVAQKLWKWFDTNYHYLVPEFTRDQKFSVSSQKPFNEFREALALDIRTKPVLLGPVSYLLLGRCSGEEFERLDLLDPLIDVYCSVVEELQGLGAEYIQIDEPALVTDLQPNARDAFKKTYARIRGAAGDSKLLLGTYFGRLGDNLDLALSLPVDALHVDAVEGPVDARKLVESVNHDKILSLGVVDGRNVWKNDLSQSLDFLERAKQRLGNDRLIIAPSSSLLHVPHSVTRETALHPEVQTWLAFAREKLQEVVTLRDALGGKLDAREKIYEQSVTLRQRSASDLTQNEDVRARTATLERDGVGYRQDQKTRREIQSRALQLPKFPTTTIGSFPQTKEVRLAREQYRRGQIPLDTYDAFLRRETAECIRAQEEIGLDVPVHGEFERNDMVQYFADDLNGFASTQHGWVQSFGSRYVRPPIIYGDVSRKKPMTVEWAKYAQSLTDKPVKGMLTGPVTILHWSFVRDDIPESETCRQIALAIRDEVEDLEEAGIKIIQVDEPALREGLPLRKSDQAEYLRWSTDAFRTAINTVRPETQIHTHMCYAEFNDILDALDNLDIDVITIEAARSRLSLLNAFQNRDVNFDIGPGLWDIHSPRVPSTDEIVKLIETARTKIPDDRLWINPDCGLKTRSAEETWASLAHLVEAARLVRSSLP